MRRCSERAVDVAVPRYTKQARESRRRQLGVTYLNFSTRDIINSEPLGGPPMSYPYLRRARGGFGRPFVFESDLTPSISNSMACPSLRLLRASALHRSSTRRPPIRWSPTCAISTRSRSGRGMGRRSIACSMPATVSAGPAQCSRVRSSTDHE
jgi:hypothetical protein